MVFDFHRSCLQSAIKVHWRKPTIFGDAKIDYYLLKVSLTEHVQNILRLHLYAYYTWPLTRPTGPVLTFRTCEVTAVTPLCGSPPPLPTPPRSLPFLSLTLSGSPHRQQAVCRHATFSEKYCVTIYRTTVTSRLAALGFPPVLAENLPYQSTSTRSYLKNYFLPFFL